MMKDSTLPSPFLTRREMLTRMGGGFGMLGLAGALNQAGMLTAPAAELSGYGPHFSPKAKRVIFLMMNGGHPTSTPSIPSPHLRSMPGKRLRSRPSARKPAAATCPRPSSLPPAESAA